MIAPLRQMRLLFWRQIDLDIFFFFLPSHIYTSIPGKKGMGEVYGMALSGPREERDILGGFYDCVMN